MKATVLGLSGWQAALVSGGENDAGAGRDVQEARISAATRATVGFMVFLPQVLWIGGTSEVSRRASIGART
jgi:hypothetical protein